MLYNATAIHSNFNDLKIKTMTAEQIAKKYVHGLHYALTDRQEIKDMMNDIETYAESYHQAKLKLLGKADVVGRSELFDLLNWMKYEPLHNVDDINEILDDYEYYKSNSH